MTKANIEEKRKKGESDMNDWLNGNGFSFLYITQDLETFARLFQDTVKRPDFLVLLDSIGLIAVDVKKYTPYKRGQKTYYSLSGEKEVQRVLAFERIFRIPVWYAYHSEEEGKVVWHWISALKAVEVGEPKHNKESKEEFLAIDIKEFEEIRSGIDVGKLYTHRLPGLNKVATA